ncbi:MAG: deoxynucleoside kinase [Phycisphaerae bacterium]|nr:deoxynucleoside kinase [Phycisphaerae bacterium]
MGAGLISIIGPPAVGKTTLAEILSEALGACMLREDYWGNPFLAGSFRGREEFSLPSQLYFLFMRVKQLSAENWPGVGLIVTDYGFCQDPLYAKVKLTAYDMQIYEQLRRRIEGFVVQPRVLIHLDAPAETLLARIEARGRDFEAGYDADYLEKLRRAHFDVPTPPDCAKLSVDCEQIDLLDAASRKKIMEQVREIVS